MAVRLAVDPVFPDPDVLNAASTMLREGKLVVYPTETLYGVGADPWNVQALERIQIVKQRPEPKPVLLIASSIDTVRPFVAEIPADARRLMEEFWPGPLTLLLKARETVPQLLTMGTGRIGIRIPSNALCIQLLQKCGMAITSTSANITGLQTPDNIDGICSMLGDGIDCYLDAGTLKPSKPSTVIDVSTNPPQLIRAGAVACEELIHILPHLRT